MPIKNRKARASQPISQQVKSGKVSWFGGPHDPSDSGHTASGGTTAEPGIAVYDESTLGGYWKVTTHANGRTHVEKQTDIGPAPWTNRVVDITYSALSHFGYTEQTFPTDSLVTAVYLGKDKQSAMSAAGIDPVGQVATSAGGTAGGFGQAENVSLSTDLSAAGDALSILKDLLTGDIGDLGSKLALASLAIVRETAIGFFDLIVAPAWHWNQRAVAYYVAVVLDPKAVADPQQEFRWGFAWTAVFWGAGYVLLWTEPGSGNLKPAPVHRSRLARHVRRGQAVPARRSLVKPAEVKAHTPKKPKEQTSTVLIRQVNTMSTTRNRPVRVHAADTIPESVTTGTEIKQDTTAPPSGATKPDAEPATGKGPSQAR